MLTTTKLRIFTMTVIEFIKEFKIPQKILARMMDMNYITFRKKMNEAGSKFSDEELEELTKHVRQYAIDLNKNVQKYLPELA